MAEFRLETERLVLRDWREKDRASFQRLFNTPAMMRFLGGVASAAAMDRLLDKRLADQARDGFCYWAVTAAGTGELIGSCGLRRGLNYAGTPVAGMLEAGWRIGEAFWRRGFAAEAMQAVIAWGWRHCDDEVIGSWTTPANTPSLSLMHRLGFRPERNKDFSHPESGEACLVHTTGRSMRADHLG